MPALEVSSTISKWQKLSRRHWPLTAAGYVTGHVRVNVRDGLWLAVALWRGAAHT